MEIQESLTFQHPTDNEVALHGRSFFVESVEAGSSFTTCRLVADAGPGAYTRIEADEYFYLASQLRIPESPPPFAPQPVRIELRLHPDIFKTLPEHLQAADNPANLPDEDALWRYLVEQNRAEPYDPIFSTESWLALSVTQTDNGETIGFRTLWNEITPSALDPASIFGPETMNALLTFLTQRGDLEPDDLQPGALESHDAQSHESQSDGQADDVSAELDALLAQLATLDQELAAMTDANASALETQADESLSGENIVELFARYFEESGWGYESIEGGNAFSLQFQGSEHMWQCVALARAEQAQAVFYSLVPELAPAARRAIMAELITRINYGLVVGNFEMDWDDGEMRFKTSLHARAQPLNTGWLHNLVYANLSTMDYYLQAILAVAGGEMTPEAALESLEG